jgi:hypothetical protein
MMVYVHGTRAAALVLAAALFLGSVFPGSAAPGAQKAKVSAASAEKSQAAASFEPAPVPAAKVMINNDSGERAVGSLGGEWMPPMPAGAGAKGAPPVWRLISARLKMKGETKPDRGVKFRYPAGANPEFVSAAAPTQIGIFLHRGARESDDRRSADFSIDPASETGPTLVLRDGNSRWTVKRMIDDELVFQVPFWVVCKETCTDQEVDTLIRDLPLKAMKRLETGTPATASAPPATSSPDKKPAAAGKAVVVPPISQPITVTLLDEKGVRLQNPAAVRLSRGTCERRSAPYEARTDQKGEARFDLVWVATERFCVEVGDGPAARCFPLAAGILYLTIYENMPARWMECPAQTFKVVINLFGNFRPGEDDIGKTVSLSGLKMLKSLTFRNRPVQSNNTVTIDALDDTAPMYDQIRIEPTDYYTHRGDPVIDRTNGTLTLKLEQNFVILSDLQIDPVNSAGGTEKDCRLSLQIDPEKGIFAGSELASVLRNRKEIPFQVVKEGSFRYFLPEDVRNGPPLVVRWPYSTMPSDSPVTIKSTNETCVIRPGQEKLPRYAFLGTPYRIVVRESKPGFALIATRVDRGDLDFLGMTPSLETSFWTDVFAMADELDHDPNSDRTRFEWSRISQWQSGALADKENSILQPSSNGALLFGPAQARLGVITQSVDKLTTEPPGSVVLKPVDLVYHLNSAVRKMANSESSSQAPSNLRVLVVGPRLTNRRDRTICPYFRDQEMRDAVQSLNPKASNIRLAFLEIVKDDAPVTGKEFKPATQEGLVECNLQDTPLVESTRAFLLKSTYLAGGARKAALNSLAKLLNAYFANQGG